MDEGTATVIASVVAASGSVAVAWITTRPKQTETRPPQAAPGEPNTAPRLGPEPNVAAAAQPVSPGRVPFPGGDDRLIPRIFLWFLYFLTGVLLVVCGSENDYNQPEANAAAGFAIMFGIAAYFIRRRIRR